MSSNSWVVEWPWSEDEALLVSLFTDSSSPSAVSVAVSTNVFSWNIRNGYSRGSTTLSSDYSSTKCPIPRSSESCSCRVTRLSSITSWCIIHSSIEDLWHWYDCIRGSSREVHETLVSDNFPSCLNSSRYFCIFQLLFHDLRTDKISLSFQIHPRISLSRRQPFHSSWNTRFSISTILHCPIVTCDLPIRRHLLKTSQIADQISDFPVMIISDRVFSLHISGSFPYKNTMDSLVNLSLSWSRTSCSFRKMHRVLFWCNYYSCPSSCHFPLTRFFLRHFWMYLQSLIQESFSSEFLRASFAKPPCSPWNRH